MNKNVLNLSLIVLVFSFQSINVCAAPKKACLLSVYGKLAERHTQLTVIDFHANKTSLPQEYDAVGRFWGNKADFSSLQDGEYVYLINTNNELIFSTRVPNLDINPDQPGTKFLATHRGLYKRLENLGKNQEIVAAVEFKISNGRVSIFNNKSGTFRGNSSHLQHAENVFFKRGLPIEVETVRVDVSTQVAVKAHFSELERAEKFLKFAKTDDYKKMKLLSEKMYKLSPSSSPPGTIDANRIYELTSQAIEKFDPNFPVSGTVSLSREVQEEIYSDVMMNAFGYFAILEKEEIPHLIKTFKPFDNYDGFRLNINVVSDLFEYYVQQLERVAK